MNKSIIAILLLYCSSTLLAQTESTTTSFECEVVLDIYNGLYDWETDTEYSGGQLLSPGEKICKGARTVANKNDTNGNGIVDNTNTETSVTSSNIGRNEIDLMKLVVRKKSGSIPFVKLKKISGSIQLWSKSTKGSPINFDANNEITITDNDLDATFYIEALNESSSLRDIEIHLLDSNDKVIDKVKATAVWCQLTNIFIDNLSAPEAGTGALSNLDYNGMINHVNNTLRSSNGQLYGYGDYRSNGTAIDKAIGGRVLYEYTVFPSGAGEIVAFDITRQKEAKRKGMLQGGSTIVDLDDFIFPFNQNQNVEKPNDDNSSIIDEDNFPENDRIYVEDPPGKPHDFNAFPQDFAFIMERVNFLEFVRVGIESRPPIIDDEQNVFGSRASATKPWSVAFNFKRGEDKLFEDNAQSGVTSVRPAFGINPIGNGTFDISSNGSTNSSSWSLTYSDTDKTWSLLDNEFILPGTVINETSNGTWTANYNGITILIQQGTIPFSDSDSVEFEIYRALNKSNGIQEGHIDINSF